MSQIKKVYLGDAVYAEIDGYNIVLTTENGIEITNTIYLEPEVISNFLLFLDNLNKMEKENEND